MPAEPRILVIACGGTISSTQGGKPGVVPSLTSEHLVSNIPGLDQFADIDTRQFRQLPSIEISLNDVLELARLISATDYDGYVITHGTDTIEETAFALEMLYNGTEPVVITGAMRHPGLESADGNANIMASVITASSREAENLGVLVVMNDEIHPARFVVKAHTSSTAAFRTRIGGPLGWISENTFIRTASVSRLPIVALKNSDKPVYFDSPAVPVIKSFSGDDGGLLALAIESGLFPGLVIESLGGGHVSRAATEQVQHAAGSIPVVLASRTGSGTTLSSTYGYPGSEIDLVNKGAIMAGWLSPIQARIFLQLQLATGADVAGIRKSFLEMQFTASCFPERE